jgi:hypothetical protein
MHHTGIIATATFVLASTFASSAALSAEAWECVFHTVDGPTGLSTQAIMEIDEKGLKWILPAHPMPIVGGYIGATTFQFAVLQNNDIGLVAASPQARTDKDVGVILGAFVVVLNKSSGAFHGGSVWMAGVSDSMKGTCKHK